ncbi:extracellular solute-binding protein [Kibdelosporangium philippinense]|uniref:Extracellular solute-binding protein n=1 Tax=Kibdelosporangium philippinense TaxID=211113 RepID=A0ABS8ZG78_9PSEU|nr:extracellular solute-binding protein [Kibdelosporangium philippinense]MCE7004842.1 extracellular solute-binding protein [Kibdelosporangium philippinense]
MKWSSFGFGAVAGVVATGLVWAWVTLPSDESALEPGELVIMSGKDQSNGGQRKELVNQWNQMHPNNQAKIKELPLGADEQYSEMVAHAQASGEKVDVYNIDVAWTAVFAERGYLQSLDEVNTDDFLAKPLQTARYEGKLWALPFNADAGLMYYRNPGVKKPSTWDDIVDETRRLFAEPRDAHLKAGYTAQLADYEGLVVNALEAIWDEGGEVVDEDGVVRIDSPEARAGLRRLADGLRLTSNLILPEAQDHDETSSMTAFGEGKVAFMRNWPVAFRNLQSLASDDANQPAFFAVVPLPGPSVLGGQNLGVSSKSTKPRAARALIEFLTSPRSQQILFERGGFAATREVVYRDAEVQRQRPYAGELLDAINNAKLRPVTPCYTRFAETFRNIVRPVLLSGGGLPPDATQRLTDAKSRAQGCQELAALVKAREWLSALEHA